MPQAHATAEPATPARAGLSPHRARHAARVLRAGGVIAHATEGVWGLACDALDAYAVWRVFALKNRDTGRGLIVIADRPEWLAPFVDPDADTAWQRAVESWPGATTWLLPAHPDAPEWLTGTHATIALRQTAHADSAALSAAFGGPLVSTSANVSSRPPVRNTWQARARFGTHIDFIAGGTPDTPGVPSTIRNAADNRLIRGA